MNFLTLSNIVGPSEEKIFGSFLNHNIKSNTYNKYSAEALDGLKLTKTIEEFILGHPAYKESVERLNPRFRKYGKLLIPLFYDHFLAASWDDHAEISLNEHSKKIYAILESKTPVLPYKLANIAPLMIGKDWFNGYSSLKGTFAVIKDMIHLNIVQSSYDYTLADLMEKYPFFKEDFKYLYPQLVQFVRTIESPEKNARKVSAFSLVSIR